MKDLLNVLYITTPETYLGKEGECVSVRQDGASPRRIPLTNLQGIICLGRVTVSPYLMAACAEKGVTITYLTENGRFLASVHGEVRGNVLLRREQYRRADDEAGSASIARCVLKGKLGNARTVLRRGAREAQDQVRAERLTRAADIHTAALTRLDRETHVDGLRGVEGDAAAVYWSAFAALIRVDDPAFAFSGRNRRPPRDAVNCLLSFVYTLLAHDLRSALEGVGLDPYVGFLHRDRPGRASLALDLEEELRPILADRIVLSLINRRQVEAAGFLTQDGGAVVMDDDTRKAVITAWQERKAKEIRHPFLDEDAPIGLLPHLQALLLARHLRGDLDLYPPLIWA
ncbi:type I-C CRISPR-associated endonuclease Cas1c [Magnetospirillum sp. UT-4]|uniref:type I-C CRISPR-associated endonuclease Cas1c n=1 Tax=Magnetospirillum sp. UT-4 TaxID=2681467 RepID=UPI001382B03E|nr:type I-C CRISPR-associated endonuclease Cas1c [Magnetospirillum sp. UT-4]CAA7622820.1 CRISPR-associated endonuclease Cas1 1 [Magnetospirillum sp. UT-4]